MPITKAVKGCIEPVLTNSNKPKIAVGKPAAIPAKMIMEIPLPIPRSVICSPSHIKNIVPVNKVETVVKRNKNPGSLTKPACDSKATAIPKP